jgi:hypothetical protein
VIADVFPETITSLIDWPLIVVHESIIERREKKKEGTILRRQVETFLEANLTLGLPCQKGPEHVCQC